MTTCFVAARWLFPRRGFCQRRSVAARAVHRLPTTVVDLKSEPFREGGRQLVSALNVVSRKCIGKRRLVIVAEPEVHEELLQGLTVFPAQRMLDILSAALGGNLELYSSDPRGYQLLEREDARVLLLSPQSVGTTSLTYITRELKREDLDAAFADVPSSLVPDVLALSEMKGFGLKRAVAWLKNSSLERLLAGILDGSSAKARTGLGKEVASQAATLIQRKNELTIAEDRDTGPELGDVLQSDSVAHLHRLENELAGFTPAQAAKYFTPALSSSSRKKSSKSEGTQSSLTKGASRAVSAAQAHDLEGPIEGNGTLALSEDEVRKTSAGTGGDSGPREPRQVFLVDTMNLIFRAYYGSLRTNVASSSLGAAFGPVSVLFRRVVRLIMDYAKADNPIIFVFEGRHLEEGVDFRSELFPDYKATRLSPPEEVIKSVEVVKEMVTCLGLTSLEVPGVEADDVIATVAEVGRQVGDKMFVLSTDQDFYQLLRGDEVEILKPTNGVNARGGNSSWDLYDEKRFLEEHEGIAPKAHVDMRALIGDKSDNLPGLRGFGIKGVLRLMKEYGSLEEILRNSEAIKPERQSQVLTANKQVAIDMKHVLQLDRAVGGIDRQTYDSFAQRKDVDWARLSEWSRTLTLNLKPVETLLSMGLLQAASEAEPQQERRDLAVLATNAEEFANDIAKEPLFGVVRGPDGRQAISCPSVSRGALLSKQDLAPLGKSLDKSVGVRFVGWNLKEFARDLFEQGVDISRHSFVDLGVASFLLDPDEPMSRDALVMRALGWNCFKGTDRDENSAQALLDAASCAVESLPPVESWLASASLAGVAALENKVLPVLARMEAYGVMVNTESFEALGDSLESERKRIEDELFGLDGVGRFNIASPQQTGAMLTALGAKLPQKKATGSMRTSERILLDLLESEGTSDVIKRAARLVLQHRSVSKIMSTYLTGLKKVVNARDGKVHGIINQTTAATGRLSMSKPNLQALPVRDNVGRNVRKAIVASSGYKLMSADYEQIELRILAALSGDEQMRAAFAHGDDIHTLTAVRLYGLGDTSEVTKSQRNSAKAVNYGIPYGISGPGLAMRLRTSRADAQSLIDEYFKAFPQIRLYLDELVKSARETEYARTVTGRLRRVRGIRSSNPKERVTAERVAVNTPIQGTQADMIKAAMVSIDEEIQRRNLRSHIVLQIHDELLVEVWPPELEEVDFIVRSHMEQALELPGGVEIKVSVGVGDSWYDTK